MKQKIKDEPTFLILNFQNTVDHLDFKKKQGNKLKYFYIYFEKKK